MLVAAFGCAVLAGTAGLLVPRLIAVVPEPQPREGDAIPVSEKEPYAEIARTPRLAALSALVGVVVGGLVGACVGWAWPLVYLLPAIPLGIVLSVVDWRTMRLPSWYLRPAYPVLVVLVVACGLLTHDWHDLRRAGFGWLVMGGYYLATNLISSRLIAFGDVRLAGLLGIALGYLGWSELLVGMLSAFFVFGLPPLVLAIVHRDAKRLRMRMPFGPAMLVGAVLGITAGPPLIDWYLRSNGLA